VVKVSGEKGTFVIPEIRNVPFSRTRRGRS
jgi:hypothetical protein